MRIIPFPARGQASSEEFSLAELDAALDGGRPDALADSWRELRGDVRALAPAMAPEFERELSEMIAGLRAPRASRAAAATRRPRPNGAASADRPPAGARRGWRHALPAPLRPRLGGLRPTTRRRTALAITTICVFVALIVVVEPWKAGSSQSETAQRSVNSLGTNGPDLGRASASHGTAGRATAGRATKSADSSAKTFAEEASAPSAAASAADGSERKQQLAASISLSATPSSVQETADRVARITVGDGGFVQSSHVQVQQQGASEASLMLRLPSAKLSAALASLADLAPVHSESQSLLDITNSYDAARQRVAEVSAEQRALLRALAAATTEGQIDSLHERLSQVRGALAQARSTLQTVSQHASTAEVEVTVLGTAHAASEGLTLHRGLHDAGRVLTVTLIVLLIAAAVFVPLALLLAALAAARSTWRRYQRERTLGAS